MPTNESRPPTDVYESTAQTPIYIVIINDRHLDIRVEPWANRDAAIRRARQLAEERARQPGDVQARTYDHHLAWFDYSAESDYTAVIETTLQGAL